MFVPQPRVNGVMRPRVLLNMTRHAVSYHPTRAQVAQLLGLSYPWAPHPLAIMQAAWEEVRCRQQGGQHPGA